LVPGVRPIHVKLRVIRDRPVLHATRKEDTGKRFDGKARRGLSGNAGPVLGGLAWELVVVERVVVVLVVVPFVLPVGHLALVPTG
jgi:hypothetical protein